MQRSYVLCMRRILGENLEQKNRLVDEALNMKSIRVLFSTEESHSEFKIVALSVKRYFFPPQINQD